MISYFGPCYVTHVWLVYAIAYQTVSVSNDNNTLFSINIYCNVIVHLNLAEGTPDCPKKKATSEKIFGDKEVEFFPRQPGNAYVSTNFKN